MIWFIVVLLVGLLVQGIVLYLVAREQLLGLMWHLNHMHATVIYLARHLVDQGQIPDPDQTGHDA